MQEASHTIHALGRSMGLCLSAPATDLATASLWCDCITGQWQDDLYVGCHTALLKLAACLHYIVGATATWALH